MMLSLKGEADREVGVFGKQELIVSVEFAGLELVVRQIVESVEAL